MRSFLSFLVLLALTSIGFSKRPNVVFILTDDQRSDALGCMGHPHLKTPHIDRLAEEGLLFKNHFCTTSLCSPSRASILGGLYAHSHGVVNNFTDYPRDLPTFPRQLQSAGYTTAYIGKWHMGEDDDSKRPGFDPEDNGRPHQVTVLSRSGLAIDAAPKTRDLRQQAVGVQPLQVGSK